MTAFRRRLARRTIPTIATLAGAGLITAGLTAPSYAADPLVADVTGRVTSTTGAPLADITVVAYTGSDYNDDVEYTQTDATGAFTFTALESGSYKFYSFGGHPTGAHDFNAIPYMGEYNGDVENLKLAPAVAVTADAPGAAVVFALAQYGLITGTNTGNGAPLYRSGACAFPVDIVQGSWCDSSPTYKVDPATGGCLDGDLVTPGIQCTDQGGQAYRLFVRPGSFKVLLNGNNFIPAVVGPPFVPSKFIPFVDQFFGGKYSLADAKVITVASGQTVSASGALDPNLKTLVKARIDGQPAPGKTLKANVGRWSSGEEYTEFSYSWTINGVVVSTTSSYLVKKADLKKKIVLTITAAYGDNTGVAQLSTKVGLKNKLKAKSSAIGGGKVRFALKLTGKKLAGKFKGKAEVWYLPIEAKDAFSFALNGLKSVTPKRVGKAKVGANGTATITTKKVAEGKGLFMVIYKGSKKAAANETPWKAVKVK